MVLVSCWSWTSTRPWSSRTWQVTLTLLPFRGCFLATSHRSRARCANGNLGGTAGHVLQDLREKPRLWGLTWDSRALECSSPWPVRLTSGSAASTGSASLPGFCSGLKAEKEACGMRPAGLGPPHRSPSPPHQMHRPGSQTHSARQARRTVARGSSSLEWLPPGQKRTVSFQIQLHWGYQPLPGSTLIPHVPISHCLSCLVRPPLHSQKGQQTLWICQPMKPTPPG